MSNDMLLRLLNMNNSGYGCNGFSNPMLFSNAATNPFDSIFIQDSMTKMMLQDSSTADLFINMLMSSIGSAVNSNFFASSSGIGNPFCMGLGMNIPNFDSIQPQGGNFIMPNVGSMNFTVPNFNNSSRFNMPVFPMPSANSRTNSYSYDYSNKKFSTDTDLPEVSEFYNPERGRRLAKIGYRNAARINTKHRCYAGVKSSLALYGINTSKFPRGSAYMAVWALDHHPKFKKVHVSYSDIKHLPAGCIVVWQRTSKHPHGHIGITNGDGTESSDRNRNQVYIKGSRYSVYVPV